MAPRKRKAVDDDPYAAYADYGPIATGYPYAYAYPPAGSAAAATATSTSAPVVTVVADAPAPAKKQRRTKDPNAPVPEKRGAIFKKTCPKNILDRVDRVMSQRFFMIDRKRHQDTLSEEFSVLGSTGNVYTTVISKKPTCTCPDAMKGNHCKHILFIFLKVLQVTQESGYWYQKALLTSELEDIFARAPLSPAAIANDRVLKEYAAVASGSQSKTKKRIPVEGDDCPVCYEGIYGADENTMVFCEECGNGLHKECFKEWTNSQKAKGIDASCAFCRAKCIGPVGSATGAGAVRTGAQMSEGYLNLSAFAGVSSVRDTSTYYQGPSRGRRFYGYREYLD